MIQFCVIFQNGNKYTTRLIITELKKSDRDQTGTVYVHNQRGGANYTYTLSNLEGELNFFYFVFVYTLVILLTLLRYPNDGFSFVQCYSE